MRIRIILSLILSLGASFVFVRAQISGPGASSTVNTAYTNGTPNDQIFIFCTPTATGTPVTGSLSAVGAGGCGGPYTFTWEMYNSGTNSFTPFTVQNGASSNLTGLASGGYALTVTDNCGAIVLCDVAWVFVNQTIVDAGPAQSGCGGNINLTGTANPVANFVYYNPPPPAFIVGPTTTITVCVSATHSYVSDLGFYLVGPASCGSPTVTLMPHPQLINAANGCCCNGGNNVNNLCFSTSSATIMNPCTAGTPLSGTIGGYGAPNTMINWAPIYGCDAAAGGWRVQIYDCIGADVGALTNASITFTGNAGCGPNSITYNSGAINSAINDNSCTAGTASIYTVPTSPAFTTPITLTNTISSFLWTSNNGTAIPGANSDLTPTIPDPGVDTWFYLQATDNFGCTYTDSVFFDNTCVCTMTGINANIGPCIPATGNYTVTGQVSFVNPPTTGQLIIAGCGGVQQVFNPPFVSPTNYSLTMPANGAPCNVTATFTATPACTINVGGFTAPTCPCIVDNFTANISACDPLTNTYQVTGQVQFTSPPAAGQMIVENCDGVQQIFNAPFVSPLNYTLNSCVPSGTACDVQVYFTAVPACQQTINFTEPTPCNCVADAGTYNANIVGVSPNNYVLCYGDQINITSNNDYVFPGNVSDPTIPYNPGIFYLIYSCPPTPGVLPSADPCFEGIIGFTPNFSDVNDMTTINSFPVGTFTNNMVYYVPSTMYDIVGLPYYISVTDYAADCFDLGPPFAVTYLPEITYVSAENCNTGMATFTINGGHPAVYGSNFTASGLTPATASFGSTTCANGGNIVINGLQNGDNYSFTITDANGCPITCSGGPFVAASDATITPAGPFCTADPALQLTAVDPGGSWSATCGGCITPGGIFDPAAAGAGNHTITYDIPGICGDVQNTSITVNPMQISTITPQPAVCLSAGGVNFTAATPGGAWSATCGACIDPVTGVFTPAVSGAGNFVITYTLAGACGTSDTENFTVNGLPNALAGNTGPVCDGSNVDLTSNGGTGYVWDGPGGYNSAVQNPTIIGTNPAHTGTYTVTVTDANNCSSTATTFLTVNALPLVLANTNAPLCDGDDVTLNGNGAFNYVWTGPNGFNQNGQSPVINNITLVDNGIYTVTGTDANNCSNTATVSVTSFPLPTANFVGDNLQGCAPVCVNFTDQSNGNGGVINQWSWNIESANPEVTQNTAACFPNAGSYDATLTVTTADGCIGTLTLPNYVVVNPNPVAQFIYTPQEIIESEPEVTFASTSINATNWLWNFGDGATAIVENPIHAYGDTGIFCVTLIVETAFGCSDTTSGCLHVKPDYTLYIPNSFTVNEDGLNDIWQAYGRGIKTFYARIFDRWGEEIYAFDSIDKGWPGTKQNGSECKQDVYVYRIEVVDSKGDPHTYSGNVNLIR